MNGVIRGNFMQRQRQVEAVSLSVALIPHVILRLAHSAVSHRAVCVHSMASVISKAMCMALSWRAGSCLCVSGPLEAGGFAECERNYMHKC